MKAVKNGEETWKDEEEEEEHKGTQHKNKKQQTCWPLTRLSEIRDRG